MVDVLLWHYSFGVTHLRVCFGFQLIDQHKLGSSLSHQTRFACARACPRTVCERKARESYSPQCRQRQAEKLGRSADRQHRLLQEDLLTPMPVATRRLQVGPLMQRPLLLHRVPLPAVEEQLAQERLALIVGGSCCHTL